MNDSDLFNRGHILVRVCEESDIYDDDYDTGIPMHYFTEVLGLQGEITDSNGSEYKVLEFNEEDETFDMIFYVYENEFQTVEGSELMMEELVVRCKGRVIQYDDEDILKIEEFNVINEKWQARVI